MTTLQADLGASPSTAVSRPREVDHKGCCAGCRARVKRRAQPRKQKDPDELASFIAHVIRLVRRDAADVAEPSEALTHLAQLGHVLDEEIHATVRALRLPPWEYTWEQIGEALGIGKTAAHKRFGGDQ